MKRLSLVIPIYLNLESLPELLNRLQQVETLLNSISIELEVITVIDGSTDTSMDYLESRRKDFNKLIILELTRNFGSPKAVKAGYSEASGDAIVAISADLQDPPELVIEMCKAWLDGSEIVICERSSRRDPWISKIFSNIIYWLIRTLVMPTYPKGGFDVSLIDSKYKDLVVRSSKSTYIPILIYWFGISPTIICYERRKRIHGKSSWTFGKKMNLFSDILFGFSIRPIRFISTLGLVISLIGIALAFFYFWNAFYNHIAVPGWATIVILQSLFSGITFLMLGIISEYIWRIFSELDKKPEFIIKKVID